MTIILNGESRHFDPAPATLADLLEALGLGGKPVVVEMDEQAVLPSSYPTTPVKEGTKLEIVMIAAGG